MDATCQICGHYSPELAEDDAYSAQIVEHNENGRYWVETRTKLVCPTCMANLREADHRHEANIAEYRASGAERADTAGPSYQGEY